MATGACGINCDTCRLNLRGICSTCGSGTSEEGRLKLAAQERLLGAPCPILACAAMNSIAYCLRDCRAFPCENFNNTPYPFSKGFLAMQERRRKEHLKAKAPYGGNVSVPTEFWDDLSQKDMAILCEAAGADWDAPSGMVMRFLNEEIRVDVTQRLLQRRKDGQWESWDHPYLELMVLAYLLQVTHSRTKGQMVGVMDLKDAHFFQGPHTIDTVPLVKRFGRDPEGLKVAGRQLGGSTLEMADAAICLEPFPKIPIYYVLWAGDDEFPAKLTVLFDKSIDLHLSADAIWGIVGLVSDALLNA